MKKYVMLIALWVGLSVNASETHVALSKIDNQLCDKPSLQRGATLYVNYCLGCHSLQYVRFKDMAKDIGIVNKEGEVLEKLVNDNLNFLTDKINSPLKIAMPVSDASTWFGIAPPDLSLVTRARGKDWVYSYLKSFYLDDKRPWGVNNLIYPEVAMPHVLAELQGIQTPIFKTLQIEDEDGHITERKVVSQLRLTVPGSLTPVQYDRAIIDLVNFLDYVGEPHKLARKRLGVWVLLFLVLFTLFAYLLKREYWKDIK